MRNMHSLTIGSRRRLVAAAEPLVRWMKKQESAMGFHKAETEQLLAECGRRCCICGRLHRVQVHRIIGRGRPPTVSKV